MQRDRTQGMVGKRVHRLLVVAPAESGPEGRMWLCRCDCGSETVLSTRRINRGTTKSCGCYRRQVSSETPRVPRHVHGHCPRGAATPTYRSWRSMLSRCRDPKHRTYGRYGGRGISVCERWLDFSYFLADMGERPAGHTLDRLDVDGDYEPGNCRWATRTQQSREGRSTLKLSMDDARAMRQRADSGESSASLAEAFGVDAGHVANIVAGRKWRETDDCPARQALGAQSP